ncbi:hypothetical protein RFB10_004634 [Salmonella enterica subsp. enterica serovar Worthington]|nr:hypothetical protein [Salmonella enterica subsp. enterica serovar Worthington]ELG7337700.1 hypothetical protein [Salmonella enterica subsp. enterica serovar Worthington]
MARLTEKSSLIAGVASLALACFIFRFLRRPLVVLRGAVAAVPVEGQPGPGRGQSAHADAGGRQAHGGRDRPSRVSPAAQKRVKEFLFLCSFE